MNRLQRLPLSRQTMELLRSNRAAFHILTTATPITARHSLTSKSPALIQQRRHYPRKPRASRNEAPSPPQMIEVKAIDPNGLKKVKNEIIDLKVEDVGTEKASFESTFELNETMKRARQSERDRFDKLNDSQKEVLLLRKLHPDREFQDISDYEHVEKEVTHELEVEAKMKRFKEKGPKIDPKYNKPWDGAAALKRMDAFKQLYTEDPFAKEAGFTQETLHAQKQERERKRIEEEEQARIIEEKRMKYQEELRAEVTNRLAASGKMVLDDASFGTPLEKDDGENIDTMEVKPPEQDDFATLDPVEDLYEKNFAEFETLEEINPALSKKKFSTRHLDDAKKLVPADLSESVSERIKKQMAKFKIHEDSVRDKKLEGAGETFSLGKGGKWDKIDEEIVLRSTRVSYGIQKEIEAILLRQDAFITNVLSVANIRITKVGPGKTKNSVFVYWRSNLGTEGESRRNRAEINDYLRRINGRMRFLVQSKLKMGRIPAIIFELDREDNQADKVDSILETLRQEQFD